MTVYLDFEGKPTPVGDLSWLELAPCGCAIGITVIDHHDQMLATPEQAWAYFGESSTKARHDADKAAGFSVELVRRAAVERLRAQCSHDPVWGVAPTPIPDGYVWGGPNYSYKAADRQHLVVAAFKSFEGANSQGKTQALCGREAYNWWSRDLSALAECAKCVRVGAAMAKAVPA